AAESRGVGDARRRELRAAGARRSEEQLPAGADRLCREAREGRGEGAPAPPAAPRSDREPSIRSKARRLREALQSGAGARSAGAAGLKCGITCRANSSIE